MSEAMKNAKKRYEEKRIVKLVSFNSGKDEELLRFVNEIDDFSGWVKQKLREAIEAK